MIVFDVMIVSWSACCKRYYSMSFKSRKLIRNELYADQSAFIYRSKIEMSPVSIKHSIIPLEINFSWSKYKNELKWELLQKYVSLTIIWCLTVYLFHIAWLHYKTWFLYHILRLLCTRLNLKHLQISSSDII